MVYWTLIQHKFSDTIKEAKIKIYSDNAFEDTISVWKYGNYGGHCYVNNGAIYMQSNGKLASDEYMTLLAKFPKGMFNSNNNLNNSFEYYFQKAQDGAKGYQERKQSEKVSKFMALFMFIALIGGALVIKVIKIYLSKYSLIKNRTEKELILWEYYLIYAVVLNVNVKIKDEIIEKYVST